MAKFKIPLDIPDVEKVNTDDEVILTVRSTIRGVHCHRGRQLIGKIHGHEDPILIRHLLVLDNSLYLKISLILYECHYCERDSSTNEKLS